MGEELIRCFIVTSRVTFVPDNYDSAILPLAECPHVAGLIVIDNFDLKLLKQGLAISLIGAYRIGLQLFKNSFGTSMRQRRQIFEANGKEVVLFKTMNAPDVRNFLISRRVNVVMNMRTRDIFRKEVLQQPEHGCYNLHHGVLPFQRGTLCDLWALFEGTAAGFSIHRMTEKIDDGPLFESVTVSEGESMNYFKYLKTASQKEGIAVAEFLHRLSTSKELESKRNDRSGARYCKTPSRQIIQKMKQQGLGL